jgi:transposase
LLNNSQLWFWKKIRQSLDTRPEQFHCPATRKHYSAEDKIRIVLEGLRGEESIADLCRREAIAESLYCAWSKEFLGEARALHQEARALKKVVAEQAFELRLLKESMIADGDDRA